MRTPEEIRKAIRYLEESYEGATKSAAPRPHSETEGDRRRHMEADREENRNKAILINRMADVLRWALREPAEFAEWMAKWERMDAIAGKVPR